MTGALDMIGGLKLCRRRRTESGYDMQARSHGMTVSLHLRSNNGCICVVKECHGVQSSNGKPFVWVTIVLSQVMGGLVPKKSQKFNHQVIQNKDTKFEHVFSTKYKVCQCCPTPF